MLKLWYPKYKRQYCTSQEETSAGTLYSTECPNFSKKSQNVLNYPFAKRDSAPKIDVIFKCKLCDQEFSGFYALRQHRNTQHGMHIGSGTTYVGVKHKVGDVEDHKLREELRISQHFFGESELERARHKVFNHAVETLNKTIVNEKLIIFSTI